MPRVAQEHSRGAEGGLPLRRSSGGEAGRGLCPDNRAGPQGPSEVPTAKQVVREGAGPLRTLRLSVCLSVSLSPSPPTSLLCFRRLSLPRLFPKHFLWGGVPPVFSAPWFCRRGFSSFSGGADGFQKLVLKTPCLEDLLGARCWDTEDLAPARRLVGVPFQ